MTLHKGKFNRSFWSCLTLSDDIDGTLPLSSALPRPVIGTMLILIRVYIEVEEEKLYKKTYSNVVIPGASSASTSWANSEQKQQKQLLHSEN